MKKIYEKADGEENYEKAFDGSKLKKLMAKKDEKADEEKKM